MEENGYNFNMTPTHTCIYIGFLVAYFMFNHDCNAMGAGEDHPSWAFHLPKIRVGFPHSRRHISRA